MSKNRKLLENKESESAVRETVQISFHQMFLQCHWCHS